MELKVRFDTSKLTAALMTLGQTGTQEIRKTVKAELETVANDANQNHRFIPRSGNLDRSVQVDMSSDGMSGTVSLQTSIAPYGPYIHNGTGIYGPRKKPIVPTAKKLLHFYVGGKPVFARSVKGVRPDPFLTTAFERRKADIKSRIQKAINRTIRRAGF